MKMMMNVLVTLTCPVWERRRLWQISLPESLKIMNDRAGGNGTCCSAQPRILGSARN